MGHQLAAEAPSVAAAYDWSTLGEVVDVGGGDGSLLIALLRAHPTLRGTVLDLPSPAATAAGTPTAAGLADRGAAPRACFEPLPAGAVSSPESFTTGTTTTRAASFGTARMRHDNGKVFVIEDTEDVESVSTEMDLRMFAYCGGKGKPPQAHRPRPRSRTPLGTVTSARHRSIVEFLQPKSR